ncbi:hypothetical protein GCM10027299_41630 [Larkinella ripae]
MKIIFICGSLEAGRDGVGDYTRKLAGELIAQNHQVAIIALNDRHLKQYLADGFQHEGTNQIYTLRLSPQVPWKKRIEKASELVKSFNPDWISLQFVPFSFQLKGLPFGLGSSIKGLSSGRKIHLMFHELWLGLSTQSSTKHLLWGWTQRRLTKALINTLQPNVIHTQNLLYQIHLQKLGIKTALLPLFPNIPTPTSNPFTSKQLPDKSPDKINFVFFGGIHPDAPVEELAMEVANYATKRSLDVDLTLVGRSGKEQEIWIKAWQSQGLNVKMLGEQPPEKISEILEKSSIGLSTTPVALSGKSGSIAAMHAHGLPVLCVSKPWHPRKVKIPESLPGVLEYTIGNFEVCINNKDKSIPIHTTVGNIAQQFIADLSTT